MTTLWAELLPREGKFFELFDRHGAYITEGARDFIRLIRHSASRRARRTR